MRRAIIDGAAITTISGLHDALSEALAFPDWYGRNLDALHDCLTDICGEIEIVNAAALESSLGNYFSRFMRVLKDAAEENENLIIIL